MGQIMERNFDATIIDTEESVVKERAELVAVEASLALIINRRHRINIVASPTALEDLAVGYLISEGIVQGASEIQAVEVRKDQILVTLAEGAADADLWFEVRSSGCVGVKLQNEDIGVTVNSDLIVRAVTLCSMQEALQKESHVWRETGGCHVAGIFTPDSTLVFTAEDVGRHNALDKVIGRAVRSGMDPSQHIIATSGRLAGGMVAKVARAGFPILLSKAAPLDAGIELARRAGVTLCGFVRGQKLNIYAHPQRIII